MTPLEKLVVQHDITLEVKPSSETPSNPAMQGWSAWNVTLKFQGHRMQTTFFTSPGYAPKAADVIATLCREAATLENTSTFEEWAMKYGYNPDSRSAYSTYEAISKSSPKIKKFLGNKYAIFATAEHT